MMCGNTLFSLTFDTIFYVLVYFDLHSDSHFPLWAFMGEKISLLQPALRINKPGCLLMQDNHHCLTNEVEKKCMLPLGQTLTQSAHHHNNNLQHMVQDLHTNSGKLSCRTKQFYLEFDLNLPIHSQGDCWG